MLILHIIIAISTVGASGFSLIKPTSNKIRLSYLLTIMTFITGGYLVVVKPSHLVSSCITGLIFLGVVGTLLFMANKRFAKSEEIA